ncbi:hypothetical protein [Undibacterium sp. RuRC25W]|uniref:hypothetical protein n=1 Tax=Undibacterium sp. RuRC25W TaxID=3413047 RepID=UPI003BF3D699
MIMFNWFDASAAKAFGISLADFIIEKMPQEAAKNKNKLMPKRKEVLVKILAKVDIFGQTNKLNIYKKAQLGNAFKWRLIEANFDREFADEMTTMIMTRL